MASNVGNKGCNAWDAQTWMVLNFNPIKDWIPPVFNFFLAYLCCRTGALMGEGVCDASADPQDPLRFSSFWLWLESGWYQPSVLDRLILVRMRWLYFPQILLSQWKSQAWGIGGNAVLQVDWLWDSGLLRAALGRSSPTFMIHRF